MAKKDFTGIAAARVLDAADAAVTPEVPEVNNAQEKERKKPGRKPRRTYDAQETHELRDIFKTQGRKGTGAKRINLAFSDTNYNYVNTMARVRGETLTEFINQIIADSLARNADVYLRAIEFQNSIK